MNLKLYSVAVILLLWSGCLIILDSTERSLSGVIHYDDVSYGVWMRNESYGYMTITITADDYNQYASIVGNRNHNDRFDDYVTVTPLIDSLSSMMRSGDDYHDATSMLQFVSLLTYMSDSMLYGHDEYWAYPMEMLYHGAGDCEDAAFLYASLLKASGIEYRFLDVPRHLSVIVIIDGTEYRAEPTSGWQLIDRVK